MLENVGCENSQMYGCSSPVGRRAEPVKMKSGVEEHKNHDVQSCRPNLLMIGGADAGRGGAQKFITLFTFLNVQGRHDAPINM